MASAAPAGAAGAAPSNPLLAIPHGSVAAASVISAAFLLLALPVAYSLRRTRFRIYLLLLASVVLRGVAFALHAAAQAPGLDRAGAGGREAGFHALRAAGFGMAIGVCALVLVTWFKNAAPWAKPFGPRVAAAAGVLARALVPIVIISGPILGAIFAGFLYGAPKEGQWLVALNGVRYASTWALTAAVIAVVLLAAFAAACVFIGARRRQVEGGAPSGAPETVWHDVHSQILLLLAAALVLVVPAAQRVDSLYNADALLDEGHFYGMSPVPELVSVALLATPFVMGRMAMAYNWEAYMQGRASGAKDGKEYSGDQAVVTADSY